MRSCGSTPLNEYIRHSFSLTFTSQLQAALSTHTHQHLLSHCLNTSAYTRWHGNAGWIFHDASFFRCQAWCHPWCQGWWCPLAYQLLLYNQLDRYLSSLLFHQCSASHFLKIDCNLWNAKWSICAAKLDMNIKQYEWMLLHKESIFLTAWN